MSQILLGLVQALMNVASSDSGHSGPPPLGYLVIGIIWAPALVLFIAALVGKPRGKKITTVFFGFVFMMVVVFIGAVYGLSALLGIFY
jgi:4-amino-4-deoxy-L-arabinose transferase-like glycosyltransferase